MDNLSKELRTKNMRAIKSKNTKGEVLLAKAMWQRGLRYRKNSKMVFGKPDFTFKKYKLGIFVDGEFFHGHEWEIRREKIFSNRNYWIPKIERNIERDKEVNEYLTSKGWTVLRFWSSDIKKSLYTTVRTIEEALAEAKSKINYLDSPFPHLYSNKNPKKKS